MCSKVEELVGKIKHNKNIAIKKADGNVEMDMEKLKAIWNEYVAELYYDVRPDVIETVNDNDSGPTIIKEEVRSAIHEMKTGKAVGGDGTAVEVLQALGEFAVDQLTSVFQQIYESGRILDSMCKSVFVALPKVEGTLECNIHRTLSMMSEVAMIARYQSRLNFISYYMNVDALICR